MRKPNSWTTQIIAFLAEFGGFPGKTRGEIRAAIGAPPDTEVTARVREARAEYEIRTERESRTVCRYWMPYRTRMRVQAAIRKMNSGR